MIGAACQRRGRDQQESLAAGDLRVVLELVGRDVALDGEVVGGRAEILSEGQDVDAGGSKVVHRLHDLVVALAQAEHEAGLGQDVGAVLLCVRQDGERLVVARAGVAHGMRQPAYGLDVLGEHVQAGIENGLDVAEHAVEVGGQRFDRGLRVEALDRADAGGIVGGAAVIEVVAIDRGDHHVG